MPAPDSLEPPRPGPDPRPDDAEHSDDADLRLLSRSPHPYHRQSFELHPSDDHPPRRGGRLAPPPAGPHGANPPRDSPFVSDSGTEADDEHCLKGLPAPRARLHKGLRGRNEALSGSSSPTLSPVAPEHHVAELGERSQAEVEVERRHVADRARQARLAVRRYVEVALVAALVLMVISHRQVQPVVRLWFPGK